jgi:predicted enzyme related to lactoylglutathione lyase
MSLTLLLRCRDLEETRAFYESHLGFDVSESAEGTLTVEQQGNTLIFTQADLWEGSLGCSGTIYFTLTDADSYFASVKDKVTVSWPIQDMPYGSREFGIKDCNGYHLAFQQK